MNLLLAVVYSQFQGYLKVMRVRVCFIHRITSFSSFVNSRLNFRPGLVFDEQPARKVIITYICTFSSTDQGG